MQPFFVFLIILFLFPFLLHHSLPYIREFLVIVIEILIVIAKIGLAGLGIWGLSYLLWKLPRRRREERRQGLLKAIVPILTQYRNLLVKYPSRLSADVFPNDPLEPARYGLAGLQRDLEKLKNPDYSADPYESPEAVLAQPIAILDDFSLERLEDLRDKVMEIIEDFGRSLPEDKRPTEDLTLENIPEFLTRFEERLDKEVRRPNIKGGRLHLGENEKVLENEATDRPNLNLEFLERFRHSYIIGKTGSGKSTLLKNLIAQDLLRNENFGVIVISPEAGLFDDLLMFLPDRRAKDLIFYDPTDTQEPLIGFNPFRLEDGEDLMQKAGETYTVFERALGDLGVKMTTLLQNSIYALLQRPGSTLEDLDALLDPRDATLRREIAQNPRIDERTKKFWASYESSGYYKGAHEPIVNRLDPLLRPPLSDTLGRSSFSFHKALNENPSILFCNLSKLRGIQAQVVGQLLIAQIQQTLVRRDEIPENDRTPFFLYVDEFQTYAQTSEVSFAEMLNRFRKYKVGVTLAHQVTADIPSKLLSVIVGNVGTIVALQLAAEDAPFFAKELQLKGENGQLRPNWLQNQEPGDAYARTPSLNRGLCIYATPLEPTPREEPPSAIVDSLKSLSKRTYGTKRPTPPVAREIKESQAVAEVQQARRVEPEARTFEDAEEAPAQTPVQDLKTPEDFLE